MVEVIKKSYNVQFYDFLLLLPILSRFDQRIVPFSFSLERGARCLLDGIFELQPNALRASPQVIAIRLNSCDNWLVIYFHFGLGHSHGSR